MKGFVIDKERRPERDAICTTYEDTIGWAVANRPGAVPINGGRARFEGDRLRNIYRIFRQQQRKRNKRFRLGRVTVKRQRPPVTQQQDQGVPNDDTD